MLFIDTSLRPYQSSYIQGNTLNMALSYPAYQNTLLAYCILPHLTYSMGVEAVYMAKKVFYFALMVLVFLAASFVGTVISAVFLGAVEL